jgi:pectate disaccharide-lyase
VYPFWEFILAVDPENGERLVKGMWESHLSMYTNVQDQWDCFYFNRHGIWRKRDLSKTWDRPFNGWGGPKRVPHLSFISIMLDCSYAAFTIGFVNRDEKPIAWAQRFANAYVVQRDPHTKIWPHLAHRENRRERGLEIYGEKYPKATEPRLYAGHIVEYVPRLMFGALAMVEAARNHGYEKRIEPLQQAVEQWVLGYMTHAYDPETHRMKHIIIDGTDVTGYVFNKSGYFGAKAGGSFEPARVTPLHHAAVARAYRLSGGKQDFWCILRDLFRGAGLGELPKQAVEKPKLNYKTTTPEPGYVFTLVDMFRATGNREYLRFVEHIGRNIIKHRQHPENGLFTLENNRVIYPGAYKKGSPLLEPHEKKSVFELFGHKHRSAALDAQEPLALLSIYACRTGQCDKMPMWVCGGLYAQGRAYSTGHVIRDDLELWFDKPALEQWYKDRNIKYTREWLQPRQ